MKTCCSTRSFILGLLLLAPALAGHAFGQGSRPVEHVLIETAKPYDRVNSIIAAHGGRVTHQYEYVDGIAADIPVEALDTVRTLIGPAAMAKDANIPSPRAMDSNGMRRVNGKQIGPVVTAKAKSEKPLESSAVPDFAAHHPDAYSLNNAGTRIDKLHARGFTGKGTIVAVIDSGYRPGFAYLESGGSLIGGKDFVPDGGGFSDAANDGHGTFVAGLISGKGTFTLAEPLLDAVAAYAPKALNGTTGDVTLIGTAPDAKIYAVRVFGPDATAGAPLSRILDAVQHVIDLRTEYDNSRGRRGLKIDVCNLSLGVSTIEAGRGLLDRSVDALLKAGIIPVVSAGNTGPSSLTISSPGSSRSALTVGAITQAANDRILAELLFAPESGAGVGGLYQPSPGIQTAWFSSRGPNADGRLDPDVVASGLANFAQGYCPAQVQDFCAGDISIASGTSFTAPIVSGIAAVLRQAFPDASAKEIRNSIIATASDNRINDGSLDIDHGHGIPDAAAAFDLLAKGRAEDFLPPLGEPSDVVARNIERNTDLRVYSGNVRLSSDSLKPGQRFEVLYNVEPGTEAVVVSIDHIDFSLPLPRQNQFFGGDDLFVNIHSAKTSSIGANGDYVGLGEDQVPFIFDDTQFIVGDPDSGVLRITLMGDFVNAGRVSANVNVHSVHESLPRVTAQGNIRDKAVKEIPIQIPAGVHTAEFQLRWEDDWGHFPTSDIDMQIVDPNNVILQNPDGSQPGASLAVPERTTVSNPVAGTWNVRIDGFDVPAGVDKFQLRVLLDGQLLK